MIQLSGINFQTLRFLLKELRESWCAIKQTWSGALDLKMTRNFAKSGAGLGGGGWIGWLTTLLQNSSPKNIPNYNTWKNIPKYVAPKEIEKTTGSLATETSFESSIFVQHIKSHRRYKYAYVDRIFFSVIALPAILSNYERRSLRS